MTPTATDQNERIARPHIRCRHKSSAGDQKEKLQRLGYLGCEMGVRHVRQVASAARA